MNVEVVPVNETYVRIEADEGIIKEMHEFFTFDVPGARWSPQYKSRNWDGKKRLLSLRTRQIYKGLVPYIKEFCDEREYGFKGLESVSEVQLGELDSFITSLELYAHDEEIEVRDYQLDAISKALIEERTLLVSPTGSGKSLIIYVLARWYEKNGGRTLIICPTINLVKQFFNDFKDYSTKNEWDVEKNVGLIFGGQDKNQETCVCISTWQSLKDEDSTFFNQFDNIIVDECHLAKGKSLTNILEKSTKVSRRIGTTGTLDGLQIHRLILEGLLGKVYQVTTTKELIDAKTLTLLNIRCILLEHAEVDRKRKVDKKFPSYPSEMDFLVSHEMRNKFITNLALDQKGNTLILFQYVEKHGRILYDMLKAKSGDRKVFFVHGKVDADDREEIRNITEKETDAIIVGSYGAIGLGTNIRSLVNLILASPSKSVVKVLQAIGRGLRVVEGKTQCNVYDIADDLSWKKHKNYTLLHLLDRVKIYASQGFHYKMYNIKLPR